MTQTAKTPEELMEKYKRLPWKIVKEKPDYHNIALQAAQTLPNHSLHELLANADKIEAWLRRNEIKINMMPFIAQSGNVLGMVNNWDWPVKKQKSPERKTFKASEDTEVFP